MKELLMSDKDVDSLVAYILSLRTEAGREPGAGKRLAERSLPAATQAVAFSPGRPPISGKLRLL
jgi:hypothetical protein